MTQKETLAAIRALGLIPSYDPDAREYRVAPPLNGPLAGGRGFQAAQRAEQEERAYYTSDAADALGTARMMRAHLDAHPGA